MEGEEGAEGSAGRKEEAEFGTEESGS